MQRWIFWVAAVMIAAVMTGQAAADDGNYQNYIIGERAAGMGGAAIALARAVDAAYYNPAGLADTDSNSISLSASLYGFYDYKVDNGWLPNEDIKVDSFVSIPATFGSIWKLGDRGAFALSAFIPNKVSANDLETFLDTDHFFKYSKEDQTLWIGPSAGFKVGEKLSLGASIFVVYRTFSWFRDALLGNTGYAWSEDIKYSDYSLLGVLGAQYQIDTNWSAGVVIQTPSVHISGDGEYLEKEVELGIPAASYLDDPDTENKIPTKIAAGIAYQVPDKYAVALDVSYHFATGFNRLEGDDQFGNYRYYPLSREATFNANLGGEYYVTDRYPVRAGIFTNISSAPSADINRSWQPAHINKYGVSASVGREADNTTLNLGINYVWGSGDAVGFNESGEAVIVDASESYLYVFLASSYHF